LAGTNQWAPRRARETALARVEERLAADPDCVELCFARAFLLSALGRTEEARLAYVKVLSLAPAHFAALNNLGTLLYEGGSRSAARNAFADAAARHPENPIAHVNLATLLLECCDYAGAREHYETALRLDPAHSEAHQGLSVALTELGDEQGALRHRRIGFESRALTALPYRGTGAPVVVLLLGSAAGGNVPFRRLLDDRVFLTIVATVEYCGAQTPLPPHHLVFNAIGDADRSSSAITAAAKLLERTGRPVVNRPAAVLETGRVHTACRMSGLPGVRAPATMLFPREALAGADGPELLAQNGFHFPLLLRTPGFHTGRHFWFVPCAEALWPLLSQLPGREQMAIEYLDASDANGSVRKYRAIIVGDRLYPLHLAIASDWKVHYFSSEMASRPDYRTEEAAFLEDMPGVLGARAMAALDGIRQRLGLDFGGMDFGMNAAGEVLLFEANATMAVNPPEPEELWNYRRAAVTRICDAMRIMLLAKAAQAL